MDVQNVLQTIMYVVITCASLGILGVVGKYVNTKIDELQASTDLSKHAALNKYIDNAQEAITTAVASVSQTYVDSLKTNGKFDKEAQTEAKRTAIEIAKSLIAEDAVVAIRTLYGDFEKYLDTAIEAIVREIK